MLRVICILFLFAFVCCGVGRAQDTCNLTKLAEFDAAVEGSPFFFGPATFSGRQTRLVLSTGTWSELRQDLVAALSLRPQRIRTTRFKGVAGDSSSHYVVVPQFQLGAHTLRGAEFLVASEPYDAPLEKVGGVFGADRLSAFDVEMNGATKAVTLYRPDIYCSGNLVRWSNNWVEIPFKLDQDIPELRTEIDGQQVATDLHTGSSSTLMNLGVAKRLFGLTPNSPGMTPLGEQSVSGGNSLPLYSYTFKTLSVSGLTFNDVRVTLGDFEYTDLSLGMREIRQLHFYIAYKRKKIYATRADAR